MLLDDIYSSGIFKKENNDVDIIIKALWKYCEDEMEIDLSYQETIELYETLIKDLKKKEIEDL
jgi:hypothetical protein